MLNKIILIIKQNVYFWKAPTGHGVKHETTGNNSSCWLKKGFKSKRVYIVIQCPNPLDFFSACPKQ